MKSSKKHKKDTRIVSDCQGCDFRETENPEREAVFDLWCL